MPSLNFPLSPLSNLRLFGLWAYDNVGFSFQVNPPVL